MWLFSGVFFFAASLLGTGCRVLDERLVPLNGLIESNDLNSAFNSIEICANNGTLFDVTKEFGLFSLPVNTTLEVETKINSFDINSTINSIDISGSVGFTDELFANANLLDSYNIDSIDFSSLTSTSLLNDMKASVENIKTQISDLKTNANEFYFNYSPAPTDLQKANIVTEFKSSLDTVIASLDSALGTIASLNNVITDVTPITTGFTDTANEAKALSTSIVSKANDIVSLITDFQNNSKFLLINVIVPAIISNILSFVTSSMIVVLQLTNCQELANDYYALKNSTCTSFLGGVDAIWWSLLFSSVFMFLTVIALVKSSTLFVKDKDIQDIQEISSKKTTKDLPQYRLPKIKSTSSFV